MRTISFCLLSTLELSWCLASSPTSLALENTRNFPPLFFPSTHPNSLLAVFGSSNSAGVTIAQETTSFVELAGDAPDDSLISAWASPKFFTDLSAFNITHFASGRDNLEVVVGVTPGIEDIIHSDDAPSWRLWTNASAMLQLFYPKDSINPAKWPKGGSEFYATPLDISKASNVTLEYKVFFPGDFDWVKGGKLPGLYGGHTRCSGGSPALDCFSTRMMWRAGGAGELYLYAPKDQQTPSLCRTPPLSLCDTTYGLSIARGSFAFSKGAWTHVSQTVVLNSPGVQDGNFLLEVNGKVVINRTDVFYRDKPRERDHIPTPFCDPDSQLDGGLLGPLLGGLIGPGLGLKRDGTKLPSHPVLLDEPESPGNNADICVDPGEGTTQEADNPIGFQGVFFSTFFGGHHTEFATPKDQFVWFKDFALYINDP